MTEVLILLALGAGIYLLVSRHKKSKAPGGVGPGTKPVDDGTDRPDKV